MAHRLKQALSASLGGSAMTTKTRGLVLAGASAALCMGSIDAPAQDQPQVHSGGANLEEVIVSARKREESVLDVPVAINVFTAADIEAAGIQRLRRTSSASRRT
jgi:iron complex outermembrane recepter protein